MKSFKEHVQESRSVGVVPASVTKKIKKTISQERRNPFADLIKNRQKQEREREQGSGRGN